MPIHDWNHAPDYAFHTFQFDWLMELRRRLNRGLLPKPLYAMTETVDLRPRTGLLDLPEPDGPLARHDWEESLTDADEHTPHSTFQVRNNRPPYACRILTIRDDLHKALAAIVWVSGEDKRTPYRLDAITRQAVGALTRGIHLLVIDLFSPTANDPQGVHKLIGDRIQNGNFELPLDKPLTVASYEVGEEFNAYLDPVAVGDALPDAPLFLATGRYVSVPLDQTYMTSWAEMPSAIRDLLIPPPG